VAEERASRSGHAQNSGRCARRILMWSIHQRNMRPAHVLFFLFSCACSPAFWAFLAQSRFLNGGGGVLEEQQWMTHEQIGRETA